MLVRLVVNNMFSFGEEKEFNMFPASRLRVKKEHKYSINNFELLKMASIYGANGAGKSNLINSLQLLQDIILDEEVSVSFSNNSFKFHDKENETPNVIVIEFIEKEKTFLYGIEILNNIILTEELYMSSSNQSDDTLLFERKTSRTEDKINTTLNIPILDEDSTEGKIFKDVLTKNFTKPNKPLFKLLTTLENPKLNDISIALNWFEDTLTIITPSTKPLPLAYTLDRDKGFKDYVEDLMKTFYIGIDSISTKKVEITEFFGQNELETIKEIKQKLDENSENSILLVNDGGNEIVAIKDEKEYYVKLVEIAHIGENNKKAIFDLDEESDGTIRLLDFAPAFFQILNENKVIMVDEIERSIHPLLIKELIRKFADDDETNGQLIFTTHESNLLDLNIFRQDEIWFAEKDLNGCTDLYVLSDFKEHNTTDIRKGYLTGRYGSIPFLGNLKDLNWHSHDIEA